ncbi:MAG: TIGR03745 family integrating conjugative element membrane protein [[Actinobacillus] rossii]|nr:TIGR03745 family integrating conjugative element membrane protein [[Actinobacillus] rossii]
MKKALNNIKDRVTQFGEKTTTAAVLLGTLGAGALLPQSVQAEMPKMDAPTRNSGGNGGILQILQDYAYDAIVFAGLLISAYAFIKVAFAAIETFGEVRAGKKTWGDLGAICLVGVLILVVAIWLLNKAKDIL